MRAMNYDKLVRSSDNGGIDYLINVGLETLQGQHYQA